MKSFILHAMIEAGDAAGLAEALRSADRKALNTRYAGVTPLIAVARAQSADVDMLRALINAGARLVLPDALRAAIDSGDLAKVRALIDLGASATYRAEDGYDALIDAAYSRGFDAGLIELLAFLLGQGATPDGVSGYGESALRVLSRRARFDAVKLLLDAGADGALLEWSPLHAAVGLGTLADVEAALAGAELEARDTWLRTPWLLAVQIGDANKAARLEAAGADIFATGQSGAPAVHYALQSRSLPMLARILVDGHDANSTDDHGVSALMVAVEGRSVDAVDLLIRHGANLNHERHGETALGVAEDAAILRRLLDAGADPMRMKTPARRALMGLSPQSNIRLLSGVSLKEFERAALPRRGDANPEEMHEPFLHAMLRAGVTAAQARDVFEAEHAPVWCADRFGQTVTLLPDGRIVLIAGEHEDWYDLDFCIYNDVFVREADGRLRIFFYPESVFPPTDFHTATLIGDVIYVVGSLGYKDARDYGGSTPVYRLDTRDMSFAQIRASGQSPGWLNRHSARLVSPTEIEISGGLVSVGPREPELNDRVYVLDVARNEWRIA